MPVSALVSRRNAPRTGSATLVYMEASAYATGSAVAAVDSDLLSSLSKSNTLRHSRASKYSATHPSKRRQYPRKRL